MPQAVAIMPVTPAPSPQTPPAPQPSNGSASFHKALDSARKKDTGHAKKAVGSSLTAEKSSKPAAVKSKGVPAKTAKKTEAAEPADETPEAKEPKAPVAAETPASADEEETAARTHAALTAKAKAKDAAHADHSKSDASQPNPTAAQTGIAPVKAVNKDSGQSRRQKGDQEEKGKAEVEAIDSSRITPLPNGEPVASHTPPASHAQVSQKPSSHDAQSDGPQGIRSASGNADDGAVLPPDSTPNAAQTVAAPDDSAPSDATDDQTAAGTIAQDVATAAQSTAAAAHQVAHSFADALASAQNPAPIAPKAEAHAAHTPMPLPPAPPEVQFAEANQSKIVSGIHAQLLPNGGSMQIRLDPESLGTMNVSVHMRDGVMTATFETSTAHASQLLTHSLNDLKTALEAQGVSVGRLHVEQAPHNSESNSQGNGKNPESDSGNQDQPAQQQEQQRREMLRRMWKKLNGGSDPLDLVA